MTLAAANTGTFRSGLPYQRLGRGTRPLVIFPGLVVEHKPRAAMGLQMYRFLGRDYTVRFWKAVPPGRA
jgi:hypothetical protein